MDKGMVTNIADLVKIGSKLGEQVISDMAASEKIGERPLATKRMTGLADPEGGLDVKLQTSGHEPRRMTLEELRQLGVTSKDSIRPKEATPTLNSSSKHVGTITNRLAKKVLWALLMLFLFILMDFSLQVMISRQDAGLPLIDIDIFSGVLSERWQDWLWWLHSRVGGGPQTVPIPH